MIILFVLFSTVEIGSSIKPFHVGIVLSVISAFRFSQIFVSPSIFELYPESANKVALFTFIEIFRAINFALGAVVATYVVRKNYGKVDV